MHGCEVGGSIHLPNRATIPILMGRGSCRVCAHTCLWFRVLKEKTEATNREGAKDSGKEK